jgi:hypothetical protein
MPVSEFRKVLAEQGSYFVAHNATNDASTTIAGHTAPVLADADVTMTKPLIHCVNNVAGTSLVRCILDFIEIEVVTAGATGTQACWAAQLDTGATRITTPGTALTHGQSEHAVEAPRRTSRRPPARSSSSAESANVRHLDHGTIRPSIEIAGDK